MKPAARPARGLVWLVLAVALPASSAGCYRAEPIRRDQLERGYVMILPGVECYAAHHAGLARGLREAGEDRAIEINEWGSKPFGTFPNLLGYQRNRRRAADLARRLVAYQTTHPGRPVTLVGFSGGGAMALFIAEALPEGFRLDRIVLLGAAVSPGYSLDRALVRCDRGVVNFYSPGDWFMGGVCTRAFGTMDRVKSNTAGRIGFQTPGAGLLQREKLTQVGWVKEWRRLGHTGYHAGWRSRAWAREALASYVAAERP